MVGHLSAAIDMHNGDIARIEDMFCPARLTLGENRLMTQHPNFVVASLPWMFGEVTHRLP